LAGGGSASYGGNVLARKTVIYNGDWSDEMQGKNIKYATSIRTGNFGGKPSLRFRFPPEFTVLTA
jgi:hypothetical protein